MISAGIGLDIWNTPRKELSVQLANSRTNISYKTTTGPRFEMTDLLYANMSVDLIMRPTLLTRPRKRMSHC